MVVQSFHRNLVIFFLFFFFFFLLFFLIFFLISFLSAPSFLLLPAFLPPSCLLPAPRPRHLLVCNLFSFLFIIIIFMKGGNLIDSKTPRSPECSPH